MMTEGENTTLVIRWGSWEKFKQKVLDDTSDIESSEMDGSRTITFESPTGLCRIITPTKLNLMREVIEDGPLHKRRLAERSGVSVERVDEEVDALKDYSIVEMEERGGSEYLTTEYDEIIIRVSPPEPTSQDAERIRDDDS